jgi:predicted component of type VI protein secretion system
MSRRSSLTVLAVLAASGAFIAGCSSSGSSSSSTPAAASASATVSAPATSVSAPATSATAVASSANKPSAADCVTINKISSGVVSTLTPLQTEPTAKATAGLKAYLAKLTTDEASLTSPAGKAALGSFVAALGKSLTETQAQATTTLTTAIGNLSSACA